MEEGDLTMLAGGTQGWAAPELAEAMPGDTKQRLPDADLYSFGMTIYEVQWILRPRLEPYS